MPGGKIEREEEPAPAATVRAPRGGRRPPVSRRISSASSGRASASRQKAAATGPVSAKRTTIAVSDSARLPPTSAAKAHRFTVAATGLATGSTGEMVGGLIGLLLI